MMMLEGAGLSIEISKIVVFPDTLVYFPVTEAAATDIGRRKIRDKAMRLVL